MRRHRSGFTLIEILIVVIILGILAAIVVPQFSTASTDAKRASAVTTAQEITKAISLYRAQHKDRTVDLSVSWDQLTTATDVDGNTTGSPLYGPYLPSIPTNPVTGGHTVGSPGDPTTDWVTDLAGIISAADAQNHMPIPAGQ